ncbi:potassium transporter TrkG [Streptomyces griseoincarnatus]
MRVVVVGAGQVGGTVVKSLAEAHECTVIDVDRTRLEAVSHAYGVRIVHHLLALAVGTLGLALDAKAEAGGAGVFTALGAAAACLGNVGPAFGELGPSGSYAPLGGASKVILGALMLLGRIEIVPLAVLLRRGYWRA